VSNDLDAHHRPFRWIVKAQLQRPQIVLQGRPEVIKIVKTEEVLELRDIKMMSYDFF
jgi:hypothetical protein